MSAIDLMGLLVPITFFIFWIMESIWPARQFPEKKGWAWIGLGFFVLVATISSIVPLLISPQWLIQHRIFNGSGLGVIGGAMVGYLVFSYVAYLWHRNAHRFNFIWRVFHQIHHSAQRVDIPGSAIFHPFEIVVFSLLSVFVGTLLLGLDPLAAAITSYIGAFFTFFQHTNIRTPRWLGYLIQRPESHCIHHQRELHNFNYSDLPIWDIVFGTFRNPEGWEGRAGFEDEPAGNMVGMLLCKDVNRDYYGSKSLGKKQKTTAEVAA